MQHVFLPQLVLKLKVLQYFDNVRHNLATLDFFADVMKMSNHSEL